MFTIKKLELPVSQYLKEAVKKDSIYIHHTAGSHRADNVINSWNNDSLGRIATSFVIGGKSTRDGDQSYDGQIYQAFDPKYWAFHLGVKGTNGRLDKKSIAIEICNYGYVRLSKDGRFYNYVNSVVPESDVYDLGSNWREYRYFHKYTERQLDSLCELLKFLSSQFNINVSKQWSISNFSLSKDALAGAPGLWTHVNVRKDKTDCHPQPELIQMLNSI